MPSRPRKPKDGIVLICSAVWKVRFVPLVVEGDQSIFGATNNNKREIEIAVTDASPEMIGSTLVHELGHAIISTVCGTFPATEESVVQAFEVGWTDLLRNPANKWVMKVILGV